MMNVLLRLVGAHIIADFFLQIDAINVGKYKRGGEGIMWLLLHGIIHGVIAYLCLGQWDNWFVPIFIMFTHMLIDFAKVEYTRCYSQKKCQQTKGETFIFLIDQLVHLLFIFLSVYLFWLLYGNLPTSYCGISLFNNNRIWSFVIGYMIILKPAGILIAILTKRWRNEIHDDGKKDGALVNRDSDSLVNAGAWIGYCERIIALTCILMNCVEGVGFLLAAKSIFRFGDLKESKDTKLTEYVLLGTLLSMTVAICVGFLLKPLL